jgi:predicted nucleic acid-binding protein
MGVVVFDSDVLIGFMDPDDAHHAEAVAWMREATRPQTERWISAVNYSELLVGPIAKGQQDHVKAMLTNLSITTATIDMDLAERAAAVRERTKLKLPDAYALATAIQLEHRGRTEVRLATFDEKVLRAHADLHR